MVCSLHEGRITTRSSRLTSGYGNNMSPDLRSSTRISTPGAPVGPLSAKPLVAGPNKPGSQGHGRAPSWPPVLVFWPRRATRPGPPTASAAVAGVSIGSLYQYFPDKDAIVTELVRRHIDDEDQEIETRLASDDLGARTLAERTRVFVEATVAIHRHDPVLHRVLFEEAPRTPEALTALRSFERDTVAAVELLLASDPRSTSDISLAAYMTVTAIESITHRYVSAHPEGVDAEALVDELTMLLIVAI